MSIEKDLIDRSGNACELCATSEELVVYEIPPFTEGTVDECILICETCSQQINEPELTKIETNHWRCLNDSMWSQIPAVQVMSWRILTRISRSESWAQDLVDMLYLDDENLAWAKASDESDEDDGEAIKHIDSNGATLVAGDTVTLTKDLNVKGANFTAKRGTAVRGISLVADNAEQIEGRVNGQHIVILTKFVKKSS